MVHTKKMLDTVGLQKVEQKNKQFLIKKIIHGIEFKNIYETDSENKPERNYRIARRVYQKLHNDTSELFADFIRSLSVFEIQDMNKDIAANGWCVEKISEVTDSEEMLKIFQDFYSLTGRLPLSNSLLVVPDGDAPPDEKLNMKQLYDLFKNTDSHGIVSLPFLGLIQFYLEENDHTLTKNAISELYYNLSYSTLSGARDFKFEGVSGLPARLSILLRHATLGNQRLREIENEQAKRLINEKTIFEPKIEDPLDDVIEIIDLPDVEHKKSMFPYVEPTVETADEIDKKQEIIDTDFIDLKSKFDKVNDVISEQKKQKEIEDTVKNIFETNNFDDFWWEEDLFDKTDSTATVDTSKKILEDIRPVDNRTIQEIIDDQFIPTDNRTQQELRDDDYLSFVKMKVKTIKWQLRMLKMTLKVMKWQQLKMTLILTTLIKKMYWPVDNRTIQEIIDYQFIPIDDRTQQELEDDDYLSFESENEIDITSAWDNNKTTVSKPGPISKLSTDYNKKIRAAKTNKK